MAGFKVGPGGIIISEDGVGFDEVEPAPPPPPLPPATGILNANPGKFMGVIPATQGSSGPGTPQTLSSAKQAKILAIVARSKELIDAGFPYSGKTFSLSQGAQTNYLAMLVAAAMIAPTSVPTLGEGDSINLANAGAIQAFVGAAIGYVKTVLEAGTALKMQINAATTIPDVLAIVDPR